jgi:hypothetical protein
MLRRIVLVRRQEALNAAWLGRSFSAAGNTLDRLKVAGMEFDASYHPVRLSGRATAPAERPAARGFNYGTGLRQESVYALRTLFDDPEAIERLKRDQGADAADALLVTLGSAPLFALTIPSKVQSYLAAGRPIVGALDGEGAWSSRRPRRASRCPRGRVPTSRGPC